MSDRLPARAGAVPLLLEMARARRAREFYPLDHPTVCDAVKRLERVWRAALSGRAELELRLERHGFGLLGLSELRGPGIDDLAIEFQARGLRRLRVTGAFESSEMAALVDALGASRSGPEELERALESAGVRNITTTELSWAELAERQRLRAPVTRAPEPDPEPAHGAEADDTATTAVQAASPTAEPYAEEGEGEPEEKDDGDLVDATALLRLLGELEGCDELETYRRLARRIELRCDALLAAESFFDAYRAALAFARHADGRKAALAADPQGAALAADPRGDPLAADPQGEPLARIGAEARSRLQHLLAVEPFMKFVVELASSGEGLTCVQATQVLVSCGDSVVPLLLEMHAGEDADRSRLAASILIAMGEAALPGLVAALGSPTLERARRAAVLLGDLQHPRAVEALRAALHDSPHAGIRPRIARALLHVGSEQAIGVLVEALDGESEVGELAARCLGESRAPGAAGALIDVIDDRRGRPEGVRREAIRSLGRLGGEQALAALQALLEQRSLLHRKRIRPLRIAAAQALAHIGGESAREALEAHARHGDTAVRRACKSAIERLVEASSQGSSA